MRPRARLTTLVRFVSTLAACGVGALAAVAPGVASAASPHDNFASPRNVPPGFGSNNTSDTAQPGEPAHAGVAAKMFAALADNGINIQMISTSEIKTAVTVNESEIEKAAKVVHTAFGLDA